MIDERRSMNGAAFSSHSIEKSRKRPRVTVLDRSFYSMEA
jgi:hypothetical protein